MTHNPNFNWPIFQHIKLEKECDPVWHFMVGFASASILVVLIYTICQMVG